MENQQEPEKIFGIDRRIAAQSKDHIPGWGIDADPENDPTYPMKHRNGADYERFNYDKPPQQPIDREILQTIERPGISRVFGTSVTPSGLSGMIRRFAYRYSESNATHWMGLILADRVNVVEGIVEDLAKGHIPNIIKERGWAGEWKYNRKGLIQKAAVATVVAAGIILLMQAKKKQARRALG